MELAIALLCILAALLVGAISPGPSFILVAQTSLALSRRSGLAAALGMGLGGAVFGCLALLGLRTIVAQASWLYLALKLLGGAYMIYLAIRLWRGAAQPIIISDGAGAQKGVVRRPFLLGLVTQLSNPKTAVVYSSVFAAFLPASPTGPMFLILPVMIFAIEAGWYVAVALAFSAKEPRAAYSRFKAICDRIAGAVMGALGVRLIAEAFRCRMGPC